MKTSALSFTALLFSLLPFTAFAETTGDPIKISDTLSTEVARNLMNDISVRQYGLITENDEVVLRIIADMPDSASRNDTETTPAAATGNTQLACDVEDLTLGFPSTRLFTCDVDQLQRGLYNRVCVGYLEAFQFIQGRPSVYDDNRCFDFFGL